MSASGLTIVGVGIGLGLLVLLSILFAGTRASAHSRRGRDAARGGDAFNSAIWSSDGSADCADGGASSCD